MTIANAQAVQFDLWTFAIAASLFAGTENHQEYQAYEQRANERQLPGLNQEPHLPGSFGIVFSMIGHAIALAFIVLGRRGTPTAVGKTLMAGRQAVSQRIVFSDARRGQAP